MANLAVLGRWFKSGIKKKSNKKETTKMEISPAEPSPPPPPLQRTLSESDFSCHCCFELMVQPTTLTCGHSFCRLCMARWFLQSRKKECPECRQAWVGHPQTNYALRSAIEKLFPHVVDRQLELERDPSVRSELLDYDRQVRSMEQSQQNRTVIDRHQQNIMTFLKGIGATILALGGLWLVYSLFLSSDTEARLAKPVSKWSVEEVLTWLDELGPWTHNTLMPTFSNESIDGHLLVAFDDADVASVLQRSNIDSALHQRAFVMALVSLRTEGIKPPKSLWEYKSRHLGKALLLSHGLVHHPRITMFMMLLLDYEDSFLPFIHSTSPVIEHISDICLYTFKFESPTIMQWIDFIIKWLFFPYYLIAGFIWQAVFYRHWMTATYQIIHCLILTIMEVEYIVQVYKVNANRKLMARLTVTNYLKALRNYLLPVILWRFIPSFVGVIFFYGQLISLPVCHLYGYLKAKRLIG